MKTVTYIALINIKSLVTEIAFEIVTKTNFHYIPKQPNDIL